MGDGFNVNLVEIRGHASTVLTIAGMVRDTSSSAQPSVGGGVFGAIGEFFAAFLSQAASELQDVINRCGEAVDQMHTGLNQAADMYQRVDDQRAESMRVIITIGSGAR